jgi:hypothetical protein
MALEHAETFVKTLSANDIGSTGGHQGGILIPKDRAILRYFPALDQDDENPRAIVSFIDTSDGDRWTFNYIYYNGRSLGHSTRDEYRLTGMTEYLRDHQVAVGDGLELSKNLAGTRYITHLPNLYTNSIPEGDDVIVLSDTWKLRRARTL